MKKRGKKGGFKKSGVSPRRPTSSSPNRKFIGGKAL